MRLSSWVKNNVSLLEALKLKYEADVAVCQANLSVYLTSAVGVAEHPRTTDSVDELITQLVEAKEKLQEVCVQLENTS